jgi:hypothetical protein
MAPACPAAGTTSRTPHWWHRQHTTLPQAGVSHLWWKRRSTRVAQ